MNISYKELERKITNLQNADFTILLMQEVNEMIRGIVDRCPIPIQSLRLSGVYRSNSSSSTTKNQHTIAHKQVWKEVLLTSGA